MAAAALPGQGVGHAADPRIKAARPARGRYPWIGRVADILAPAAAAAPPIGRVAGARVTVMSSLFSRELLRVQCELA